MASGALYYRKITQFNFMDMTRFITEALKGGVGHWAQ